LVTLKKVVGDGRRLMRAYKLPMIPEEIKQ
jgi:hypothetical protein